MMLNFINNLLIYLMVGELGYFLHFVGGYGLLSLVVVVVSGTQGN